MLDALWEAYLKHEREHWPWERELLATIAELVHQSILANASIWSDPKHKHKMPEPLQIPRPQPDEPTEPVEIPATSHREFALAFATVKPG
jgi:hypothetical protein